MIIELARVGDWNGEKLTEKELEDVVKNFKGEVPVVLGHNYADFMPAFGWVKRVWKEGDSLYGEVELSDILKDAYEAGLYKKWSVGLRKGESGWYLHHLAFLGAVPPRIKDLKVVNFSDAKDVLKLEFEDKTVYKSYAKTDYPVCLDCSWDADGAKKRIVEKYGWKKLAECVGAVELKEGEKGLPEAYSRYKFPYCDVVDGKIQIVAKAVSTGLAYLNGARGVKVDPELEKVVRPIFEKLHKKVEKAKEKQGGKDMSDQVKKLQEELSKVKGELKRQKVNELVKVAEGKVPKEKLELLKVFAEKLEPDAVIELSEGEKKSPIDILKEIFASIPEPVKEGEMEFGDIPKKEGNEVDITSIALEKL